MFNGTPTPDKFLMNRTKRVIDDGAAVACNTDNLWCFLNDNKLYVFLNDYDRAPKRSGSRAGARLHGGKL